LAFLDDIKSKHLTNYVLVTIGDNIRISTQNINFDGEYYKPILMNIPSISESLDIEQRKYKISSVTLSISDYEHNGVRFSDSLNTLMNKEVNIYYASPSCVTLEDCYLAGTFIVRSFSQNEDTINLGCEDFSQDKLHTDFPLNELTGENVDEKYQNKPIPMVFGLVDRSPCVIENLGSNEDGGGYKIIADFFENLQFNDDNLVDGILSPLYIFNESYANIPAKKFLNLSNIDFDYGVQGINTDNQYDIVNNEIFFLNDTSDDLNSIGLPNFDKVQICYIPELKSKKINLGKNNSVEINNIENIITQEDFATAFGKISFTEVDIPFDIDFIKEFPFLISYTINSNFDSTSLIAVLPKVQFILESNESNTQKLLFKYGFVNPSEQTTDFGELTIFNGIENIIEFSEDVLGQGIDLISVNNTIGGDETPTELSRYLELDLIPNMSVKLGYDNIINLVGSNTEIDFNLDIYRAVPVLVHDIDRLKSQKFFANVIGRISSTPSAPSVFTEILSELNFNQDIGGVHYTNLGSYSFTVDKKINSKKLIEEIGESTSLYPYFKDGQFKLKSIKNIYSIADAKIIKADDVINYKYDRTKIEKVYTRVNVKYHYDYGIKDFTRETGDVTPTNSGLSSDYLTGSNENYFGEDFDQELVFESKYIRDKATAFNLARYLCGLHANQHNLITLTLPLNYINLELGDIVQLDKLIQGRRIFGEDYSLFDINNTKYTRNGQDIYKFFFVEQIKKSLDKVEIKLYQLHEFNFTFDDFTIDEPVIVEPEVVEVRYCDNPNYQEYFIDPNTNEQFDPNLYSGQEVDFIGDFNLCLTPISTPEPPPVIEDIVGCMNEDAINTNPYANVHDENLCIMQEQLDPPTITSPMEGEVLPLEIVGDPVNIMLNPDVNSFFNNHNLNFNYPTICSFSFYGYSNDAYCNLDIIGDVNITTSSQFCMLFTEPPSSSSNFYATKVRSQTFSGATVHLDAINGSFESLNLSEGDTLYLLPFLPHETDFGTSGKLGIFKGDKSLITFIHSDFGSGWGTLGFPFLQSNITLRFKATFKGLLQSNYSDRSFSLALQDDVIFNFEPNIPQIIEISIGEISSSSYYSRLTFGSVGARFNDYDIIVIEDLEILSTEGEVTTPILNVTWNASENLVDKPLPNLPNFQGLQGDYVVSLVRTYYIDNEIQLENVYTNALSPITAVQGQQTYTHSIDLAAENIPTDSNLQINVLARSFSNYSGIDFFVGLGGLQENIVGNISFPISPAQEVNILYGENALQINVSGIVSIVNHVLGFQLLTGQELLDADLNQDGLINIVDVLLLINIILDIE